MRRYVSISCSIFLFLYLASSLQNYSHPFDIQLETDAIEILPKSVFGCILILSTRSWKDDYTQHNTVFGVGVTHIMFKRFICVGPVGSDVEIFTYYSKKYAFTRTVFELNAYVL